METSNRVGPLFYHTFKLIFDGVSTRDYELATDSEDVMFSWLKVTYWPTGRAWQRECSKSPISHDCIFYFLFFFFC